MGGQNTEINNQTTAVLLESAYFTPGNIRKTSRKLGLRTESSIRFEKGLDINGIIYAVDRAAQLIQEMAEGEIVGGVFDVYPQPQEPVTIILRPERVNYLLGTELKPEEVKNYLSRLSFKSIEKDGQIVVEVPTYRPDIEMEADLIEEVARLFGYGNIPADLPFGYTCTGGLNPFQKFRDRVKNTVSHYMSEVINYSFINPTSFDLIQLPEGDPLRDAVKIANPLSEDQSIMRTTLLPGLLENISKNLARKNEGLSFFEMGSVFFPASALPLEKLQLAGIVCGSSESNWLKKGFEMDFFYLKGILENLFEELSVKDPLFVPVVNPSYHPGRCAGITCRGEQLGILGEIHPAVLSNYDIKQRVCALEIDVDLLYKYSHEKRMTQEIAKYPAVERDLAILVDGKIKASEVLAVVREAETDLLRKVVLFDLYTGEQIPEGLKSLALKITFQSAEKTLKEDEINNSLGKILENLKEKLGAAQR
jgi:phenylalanyl-tRNA synthetase beta chain